MTLIDEFDPKIHVTLEESFSIHTVKDMDFSKLISLILHFTKSVRVGLFIPSSQKNPRLWSTGNVWGHIFDVT